MRAFRKQFFKRLFTYPFVILALAVTIRPWASIKEYDTPQTLPEFTQTHADAWINSKPLTVADLRGKVVVLDFWTFGCWNCYRSFPWLNELHKKYSDQDFQIVGVHSPEFEHERDLNKVRKKVNEFQLAHPIMVDNDFGYWNRLNNRYWPSFYVVDKKGQIRSLSIGETHKGDKRAKRIDALVRELLAE